MEEITQLLAAWGEGDERARDELLAAVYPNLRAIAGNRRARVAPPPTLATTEIVHEAYLRLAAQTPGRYQNRTHFFRLAARMMRRVLLDHVRRRGREKRGDGRRPEPLDEASLPGVPASPVIERLALERALGHLAAIDERAATIVTLRFLAGLDHDETAQVLGCGRATVARGWRFARAFLRTRLRDETASMTAGIR